MRRLVLALAVLPLLGCNSLFENGQQPIRPCSSDNDCGGDQVCFVDGCGDPGKDIAVEVTPSSRNGQYPQDFPVDELEGQQLLQLFPAPSLAGTAERDQLSGGPQPYDAPITFVLSGQSALIPGLTRHFEATATPSNGSFQLGVGAGVYSVVATPDDPTLPPLVTPGQTITPGQDTQLDLRFPAPEELLPLSGVVVGAGGAPLPVGLAVQALDAEQHPLSQRALVSDGGTFTVWVDSNLNLKAVTLHVTPIDPLALVPEESFSVSLQGLPQPLAFGDFGEPLTATGRLVAQDGSPVAGASVHLEGSVADGGFFRTQTVQTDDGGSFALQTLPATSGPLNLLAVPPPGDTAGLLETTASPLAEATSLGDLACPNRILVSGTLETPDGQPAPGVRVLAEPVAALPDRPLPLAGDQTTTDTSARFTLRLDPAHYRIDFLPTEKLARTSRFVTIDPAEADGGSLELAPIALSNGRSVSGQVEILAGDGGSPQVAPLARVRFYRKVELPDGGTSSVLLDQAYADQTGSYTVLLPTR